MVSNESLRKLIQKARSQAMTSEEAPLLSYCIPWEAQSLVPFLHHARGTPRLYWGNSQGDLGFSGFGVAALLTASGPNRFKTIERKAARLLSNPILIDGSRVKVLYPKLFGGFGFEDDPDPLSIWSGFSAACFLLPRYLLSRYRGQVWLTVNHQLMPEDDLEEILWLFSDHVEELKIELRADPAMDPLGESHESRVLVTVDELCTQSEWERGVSQALEEIDRGRVEKVVLARCLNLNVSAPIDPARALLRLERNYPECYRFLFEPVAGRAFFGATPELLIHVSGKQANTVALAGSARRSPDAAEDNRIASELMNNPKEIHEHTLVVETILRSLQPFAKTSQTQKEPRIRRLANIQHLETPIEITLKDAVGVLPLVQALHPTPAVGGVPRRAALDLISRTETISRGWYASPVGWIDQEGDGLFTVAIRSAVSVGHQAMLYSGAGIVRDSSPEDEWEETRLKFQAMLAALEADGRENGR